MRKSHYYIITSLIIAVLVIFVGSKSAFIMDNFIEEKIQYKFGVGIVNGEPKYIDPRYFEVPDLVMSKSYKQKVNSEIIKAGRLTFSKEPPKLLVYDIKKDRPGSHVRDTKRELKYKVENHTLYVSADGIEWEAVKFKVLNDQPYKDKDEPFVTIYWVVHLECQWFKGEYEIFSIPNA